MGVWPVAEGGCDLRFWRSPWSCRPRHGAAGGARRVHGQTHTGQDCISHQRHCPGDASGQWDPDNHGLQEVAVVPGGPAPREAAAHGPVESGLRHREAGCHVRAALVLPQLLFHGPLQGPAQPRAGCRGDGAQAFQEQVGKQQRQRAAEGAPAHQRGDDEHRPPARRARRRGGPAQALHGEAPLPAPLGQVGVERLHSRVPAEHRRGRAGAPRRDRARHADGQHAPHGGARGQPARGFRICQDSRERLDYLRLAEIAVAAVLTVLAVSEAHHAEGAGEWGQAHRRLVRRHGRPGAEGCDLGHPAECKASERAVRKLERSSRGGKLPADVLGVEAAGQQREAGRRRHEPRHDRTAQRDGREGPEAVLQAAPGAGPATAAGASQ
mmetsp:Transcript_83354/g.257684  ORF Transcript_83354/g.257684 Transcript_83354/m.257684 type:complete len:382 (+) Transcript_83354:626-1771(+)